MTVVEFGKQNKDRVLLLHGGGLSWWNYREVAKLLEKDYHVILPVLDGHGGSDRAFSFSSSKVIVFLQKDRLSAWRAEAIQIDSQ